MAFFTVYAPTPDTDEHYQPALGYTRQCFTAKEVGGYIKAAYRADSKNVPHGYRGAGDRTHNREPNMYLLETAEDLFGNLSMVGCNSAPPKWLESLCDKCEAALAEDDE